MSGMQCGKQRKCKKLQEVRRRFKYAADLVADMAVARKNFRDHLSQFDFCLFLIELVSKTLFARYSSGSDSLVEKSAENP